MYRVLTLRLILILTFSFNPLSKKREASLLPDAIASFRPSSPWRRQRLAELVLEHILQVSDVELRGKDASSSAGGCPGGGGVLG